MIESALLARISCVRFGFGTRQDEDLHSHHVVGSPDDDGLHGMRRMAQLLGVHPNRLAMPRQRHTAAARIVDRAGWYDQVDALVTVTPELWLRVSVADCVPLFLADPDRQVVAAVHAGWKGSSEGIASKTVKLMRSAFDTDPARVLAFLGPSAGPCCYEVKSDVASRFSREVIEERSGKIFLDLRRENVRQLSEAGLSPGNIEIERRCTICSPGLLHSFRRDGVKAGRMLGFISLRGEREA